MASLSDILVTTAATDMVVARALAPEVRKYLTNQLRANFPFMKIDALEQLVEEMVQNMRMGIKKACPQMTESKARSGFFDILPAEIRNRIYEFALPEPHATKLPGGWTCKRDGKCIFLKSDFLGTCRSFDKCRDPYWHKEFDFKSGMVFDESLGRFPGILQVCHQMRKEVAPRYFGGNIVHMVIYYEEQSFMKEWLQMIGKDQAAMIDKIYMEFYDKPFGERLKWHKHWKRGDCRRKKYKPIRTKKGVLGIMGLLGVPAEKSEIRSERSWNDVDGTEVEELETLGEGYKG